AGIGFNKTRGHAVVDVLAFFRAHEVGLLSGAVGGGELVPVNVVLVVHLLPAGVKDHGIDEVHDGIGGNVVDNFFNDAVGVVFHPVVDVPDGLEIESGLVGRSPVIIGVGLQKVLRHLQAAVVPEPDGIGNAEFGVLGAGQVLHI